jgi:peptidoglycan/LPS O-acetylase OafA/YrhL
LSYSIYLTHLIIQELFSYHLVPFFPSISGPLRLLLSSACVIAVSYLSRFFIEQKFGKWLKNKLNLIFW